MQTPGGFQTGQQRTDRHCWYGCALDTAGQALGYGAQAAGMGGMYEQMATNPMAMQAYMSPYMQNVVEIQKQAAIEDAQRAQLGANLGAARQGTYGGARQTLAQTQREAGLNKQLLIFKVRDFNQRLIKHKNHNSLVLLQGFKDFKPVFRAYKVLKLGLGLLEEWVNKLQILVLNVNKLILLDLGSKARWASNNNNNSNRLLTRPFRITLFPKRCQCKDWLATTHLLRGYATPTTTTQQYQAGANPASQLAGIGALAYGASKKEGGVINEGIDALAMRKAKRGKTK
jgi:hypothetical protein